MHLLKNYNCRTFFQHKNVPKFAGLNNILKNTKNSENFRYLILKVDKVTICLLFIVNFNSLLRETKYSYCFKSHLNLNIQFPFP